jgi:ABC-type bacteriocin/lantibiotic exporter with double-glycine peptidase domain
MTLTVFLLWFYIGVSAFVGLAVLIVIVPFNSFVSGKTHALEYEKMKKNDKKVKNIYEVLNGIKVCKNNLGFSFNLRKKSNFLFKKVN